MTTEQKPSGLALLRVPFPANQISYLPKAGVKLAYVGHAALTDRLLDADPLWTWEPLALGAEGLPVLDPFNGMWIKLTVCGVTRLGYGHAGAKEGGDAIKEVIGDALRNAAMRFGAALDLWHKGDLHGDEETKPDTARNANGTEQAMEGGSHSPKKIAFEALPVEVQNSFRKNAPQVESAMPNVAKAIETASMLIDDWDREDAPYGRNDLIAGFHYLLSSTTRSAMKRHTQVESIRAGQTDTPLASQLKASIKAVQDSRKVPQ